MNEKEVGELRRRQRRDRSNMTAIYGCYVNENKEIISQFRQSTAIMPENEADKYFAMIRKVLSGSLGRNLIDITFKTAQVAGSPEHKLLMDLRANLKDDDIRTAFFNKIIDTVVLEGNYLILIGCDSYDVPFKSKDDTVQTDGSEENFTYVLCAVCPVKQTKATLHYVHEEKVFHDGAMLQQVSAPVIGFLFPAFDGRATNIYNALYYTRDVKQNQEAFVEAVFNTPIPKPAEEQKRSFEALLSTTLGEDCDMEVIQSVQDELRQRIEMHKESKIPEPLTVAKEDVREVLSTSGVSEEHVAKFCVEFDEVFGHDARIHPKNIIDAKKFQIKTPDVSIKVAPERIDLIETRVIGGVKYIMICADEDVEVNGVSIHIAEKEAE